MRATNPFVAGLTWRVLRDKGVEQWDRLSTRERIFISGLTLFLCGVLVCVFIFVPGLKRFESALGELQSNRELNGYVRARLDGFAGADVSKGPREAYNIQDLVIKSAKSEGVDIDRYELSQDGAFSVSISKVAFSKLIGWLGALEKNAAKVSGFSISRVEPGVVSCALVVRY